MVRQLRQMSETGIYHVMARGVNKQPLFEEDADSRKFLEVLADCKNADNFELFAYCLMGNHFHLLVRPSSDETLTTLFQRIGARYVGWFNRKYDRVGHLFQDRFASEAVEDETYFLSCLRYILQNPVAAGICASPFDYEFSSAREYERRSRGLTDIDMALDMIGENEFRDFICAAPEYRHLDVASTRSLTDADLRKVMVRVSGCMTASEFQQLAREERNLALMEMRRAGGSIRQVSRLTGISVGIVRRFTA